MKNYKEQMIRIFEINSPVKIYGRTELTDPKGSMTIMLGRMETPELQATIELLLENKRGLGWVVELQNYMLSRDLQCDDYIEYEAAMCGLPYELLPF